MFKMAPFSFRNGKDKKTFSVALGGAYLDSDASSFVYDEDNRITTTDNNG